MRSFSRVEWTCSVRREYKVRSWPDEGEAPVRTTVSAGTRCRPADRRSSHAHLAFAVASSNSRHIARRTSLLFAVPEARYEASYRSNCADHSGEKKAASVL